MIEFRQKDFSRLDSVNDLKSGNFVIRAPYEFMKTVEMITLEEGKFVQHWIQKKCIKEGVRLFIKLGLSPQLAFSLAIEEDYHVLEPYLGANVVAVLKNRFGNNQRFIENLINFMFTETIQGREKYIDWFSDPLHQPKTPQEYKLIFKLLGLAISGQIPRYMYENPINYMYRLGNYKVDYSLMNNTDPIRLCKLIADILPGLCGVPDSYYPIQRLKTINIL